MRLPTIADAGVPVKKMVTGENLPFRWLTLAGAMTLVVCAFLPWFRLPVLQGSLGGARLATTSVFQLPFQIVFGVSGVACIALYLSGRRLALSCFALVLLLALGIFPNLVMLRDPSAAFAATELKQTNKGLLNEALATAPDQMESWKRSVNMLPMDRTLEVMQFRIPDVEFFSVPNLDIAVVGFGFSNDFLEFMGSGYPLAWAGCLLLISAAYLMRGIPRMRLFQRQAGVFALMGGGTLVLAITPVLASNYYLRDAEVLAAQGLYSDALGSMAKAIKWVPVTALSTQYHDRIGEIRYQLQDRDDPDFYLFLGDSHSDAKQYEEAVIDYRESLRIRPNDLISLHSLSVALTNIGVEDYASGQYAGAISLWRSAIQVDPLNIKALYEVQIGYFQVADLDEARRSAQALLRALKTYRLPSMTVIAQAYVHLSWCAYQTGDYDKAFYLYRRTVDPTLW